MPSKLCRAQCLSLTRSHPGLLRWPRVPRRPGTEQCSRELGERPRGAQEWEPRLQECVLGGVQQRAERERTGTGWWTGHAGPGSATPQTAQPSGCPVSAVLDPQSFIACGCGFPGHRELTLSWKRTFLLNPNTCIWKGKQQHPCNRRGGLRKPGVQECPRRTPPVAPWSLREPGRCPPTLASVSPRCLQWRLLSTHLPSASGLEAREPSVHPRSQEARLPAPPVGSRFCGLKRFEHPLLAAGTSERQPPERSALPPPPCPLSCRSPPRCDPSNALDIHTSLPEMLLPTRLPHFPPTDASDMPQSSLRLQGITSSKKPPLISPRETDHTCFLSPLSL